MGPPINMQWNKQFSTYRSELLLTIKTCLLICTHGLNMDRTDIIKSMFCSMMLQVCTIKSSGGWLFIYSQQAGVSEILGKKIVHIHL